MFDNFCNFIFYLEMSSFKKQIDAAECFSGSSVTSKELEDRDDDFQENDTEHRPPTSHPQITHAACGHLNCFGMTRCIEAFEAEKQCIYCNMKKSLCECGDLGPVTSPSTSLELSSTNSSTSVQDSSTDSSVVIVKEILQIDGGNSSRSDSLKSEDDGHLQSTSNVKSQGKKII